MASPSQGQSMEQGRLMSDEQKLGWMVARAEEIFKDAEAAREDLLKQHEALRGAGFSEEEIDPRLEGPFTLLMKKRLAATAAEAYLMACLLQAQLPGEKNPLLEKAQGHLEEAVEGLNHLEEPQESVELSSTES